MMRKSALHWMGLLLAALAMPVLAPGLGSLHAAQLPIMTAADGEPGCLRQVLASSQPGDTLVPGPQLRARTLRLDFGELVVPHSLTLLGGDLGLIVDAKAVSRHFRLSGQGTTLTLRGITLQNGRHATEHGGSILAEAGTNLTAVNCIFRQNEAKGNGGALAILGGTLQLMDVTLDANRAGGLGGAAFVAGPPSQRLATSWKGLSATANRAGQGGGALWMEGYARLNLRASKLAQNETEAGDGGALMLHLTEGASLTGGAFRANVAAHGHGGAVYMAASVGSTPSLAMESCGFQANRAGGLGGGLFLAQGVLATGNILSFSGNGAQEGKRNVAGQLACTLCGGLEQLND